MSKTRTHQTPKNFANGHGILCAGLPRTGTSSLKAALEILGITPVHHALHLKDFREYFNWGRAAWCTFPFLREQSRDSRPWYIDDEDPLLPWGRSQWDELIGRQRAITDVASLFSEDIIACYPEAKVILVERSLDSWTGSFGESFLDHWLFGFDDWFLTTLSNWVGYRRMTGLRDTFHGWIGASSRSGAYKSLPDLHAEHHAMVRARVPKDQLLDFNLKDGWEPLCKFLDVPVPDMPFPHVNERESLLRQLRFRKMLVIYGLITKLGSWMLTAGLVVAAIKGASRAGWFPILARYRDIVTNYLLH